MVPRTSNYSFRFSHDVLPQQALSNLASLLGLDEQSLEAMLTQRVVTTHGEVFTIQLDVSNAELTRDAIVKSLYEVGQCRHRHTPRKSPQDKVGDHHAHAMLPSASYY